ncbi:hypothetical protein KP509_11G043900 [Ceratopteris richardii]|uniref:Uncharacterized protein n=1 Tax=Ceratopteris richardii TaxID=49495 RepID=A0A8T2TSE7_CERRI|nr:hypothetical protein KP509_11G043900 [Ceratopteris richardii]
MSALRVPSLSAMLSLHSQDQAAFKSLLPFSTRSDLGTMYDLGPELGRGQYGIIRHCRCRSSGSLFACTQMLQSVFVVRCHRIQI